jgi:aminoglycoside 3-N-acetyltransferase
MAAITYREITIAFRELGLSQGRPAIVHASLSSIGDVRSGVDALLGALLGATGGLMMPVFTYKTMLTPEVGPEDNGMAYGNQSDANRMAEFFTPAMPADRLMGTLAETLRRHPQARRSNHPILSFAGVGVDQALSAQTMDEPLAPMQTLLDRDGVVMLIGVDHTVNTSLHLAEKHAGRKQFVRWALTPQGVQECPAFPGCSDGFNAIAPRLEGIARQSKLGQAEITLVPLAGLLHMAEEMIAEDPAALLCARPDCPRCSAVRASLQ